MNADELVNCISNNIKMAVELKTAENSIKKFYDDCEIFITGGTGFVGRVLIEKLLRSCPGVKKIHVVIRMRKGISSAERLKELTNCKLFQPIKSTNPEQLEKLHAVDGDVQKILLGLSDQDIETVKKCSVVFHCAASVRFDDPFRSAIFMNTRGTLEILKIAEQIPHLKAFVHVSTSFIQPKLFGSDEIFYSADGNWRNFIRYAETFDDEMLNALEKKLTRYAPNTYTFTKHLSEQICKFYKDTKNLPIVIYRPSIIAGSEIEPFPGWIDNLNGPFSYCFTAVLGLLHTSMVNENRKLDYIPVDICVKGMIVAAWKTWKEHKNTSLIPIYNATSIKKPSFLMMNAQNLCFEYPSANAIMYMEMTHTNCHFRFWMIKIFEQIIPALVLDGLLRLSSKKPKLLKFQRIIMDSEQAMIPFTKRDFNFTNYKYLDLNLAIPIDEQSDFSVASIHNHEIPIIKAVYLNFLDVMLKEDISDFTKAKRRQKIVNFIWRSYQFLVYSGLLYLVLKYFYSIFSNIDFRSIFIED